MLLTEEFASYTESLCENRTNVKRSSGDPWLIPG
jgi:hypothetical protein